MGEMRGMGIAAVLVLATVVAMGCVSVAPTPPAATNSPAPTLTPGPTPSPSPSPSPSPAPTATPPPSTDGQAIIALFRSGFGEAQPPFHLECEVEASGTVGGDSGRLGFHMGGDVSGEDFSGQVIYPGNEVAYVVFADGVAYIRTADSDWLADPDFEQTQPLNPFSLLEADDLEYRGVHSIGGDDLHQLRTDKWIGGELDIAGWTDMQLESNSFDIYVDEAGVPAEAHLRFRLTGNYLGDAADLTYVVLYYFTQVGEPVTIEAPI
jgi:hypothetical protein